jgi:hypothetical protein
MYSVPGHTAIPGFLSFFCQLPRYRDEVLVFTQVGNQESSLALSFRLDKTIKHPITYPLGDGS